MDGIRKGDDGLVYFNHQDKDPDALPIKRSFAFDCEKGLMYDSLFGADWKCKGLPVTEGAGRGVEDIRLFTGAVTAR